MRLIDADKLMEYCQNLKERKIDCNDIARFPTAYDVDKVVEQIEFLQDNSFQNGIYNTYQNAIEIIKAGATNDN